MTQAYDLAKETISKLYTKRDTVGSNPQRAWDLDLEALKEVRVRSESGNTATLLVGWENMQEATGYPLYAKDELSLKIKDLRKIWVVADAASITNEVQTVSIDNLTSSGTFTLTFDGQTTAPIDWNATASAVQSALEALSNVNVGDVSVAGGPGPGTDWVVTFTGQYSGQNVSLMTGDGTLLVGGSTTVTVTETTPGAGAAAYSVLVQ